MPAIVPIETERLKLVLLDFESISPDDHQRIEQRLGLQLASMILGEQIDRDIKAAMRTSLENVIRDKKQDQWYSDWQSVLIILKKDNKIIGGFCFQRYPDEDGTVQIGYMIQPEYQRDGYMTEALKSGIAWIFERPDISAVLAETTKSNLPSQKVLKKIGMVLYKETLKSLWWKLKKCA
jgi:ribosomal-protein-alanine N-acetyltransferase